jgi:hypothetical protein
MSHARPWLLAALLGLAGCSSSAQSEVSFAAFAVPAGTKELVVEDVTVTVEEARLALGPVYFCASAAGSAELCETALGEIRDVTRIDALAAEAQPIGGYRGFTGDIQSASYDYGIHWYLTEDKPTPTPEAPGGHSVHVEGMATQGSLSVRFVGDVDVVAPFQGERAVPTTKVEGTVSADTTRVEVRFDVASWLSGVDWPAVVASGQDPYAIASGSRDHTAIVGSMVTVLPPTFVFVAAAAP